MPYLLACEVDLLEVLDVMAQMWHYIIFLSHKTTKVTSDSNLNYLTKIYLYFCGQYPLMNFFDLYRQIFFAQCWIEDRKSCQIRLLSQLPMGYKKLVSHEVRLFFAFPNWFWTELFFDTRSIKSCFSVTS